MLYREINYKRRRTFNEEPILEYIGNELVELCAPHVKLKNNKIKYSLYILPMWSSKFVECTIEELSDVIRNYYHFYLK
jgi:hypothetical protein